MEGKTPKSPSRPQHQRLPHLVQEADELRSELDTASSEAHQHAGLAFLFGLILNDPVWKDVSASLMRAFRSEPSAREDVHALAALLKAEATSLNMHPLLLALAMIWWGREADLAEAEIAGSADWQLLPMALQGQRRDLQEEFRLLSLEIEAIFRGSGLEPELAVQLARRKCKALDRGLAALLKSIQVHRARRKRLFYACSKAEARAYYLLRVRKLKSTSKEAMDLLLEAGEQYDRSQKEERLRAQKKVHEWGREYEKKLEALMLDAGFIRKGRAYQELPDG